MQWQNRTIHCILKVMSFVLTHICSKDVKLYEFQIHRTILSNKYASTNKNIIESINVFTLNIIETVIFKKNNSMQQQHSKINLIHHQFNISSKTNTFSMVDSAQTRLTFSNPTHVRVICPHSSPFIYIEKCRECAFQAL